MMFRFRRRKSRNPFAEFYLPHREALDELRSLRVRGISDELYLALAQSGNRPLITALTKTDDDYLRRLDRGFHARNRKCRIAPPPE